MDFGGAASPFPTWIPAPAQPPPVGCPTSEMLRPQHPQPTLLNPSLSGPHSSQFLVGTENIPEAHDGFGSRWKMFSSPNHCRLSALPSLAFLVSQYPNSRLAPAPQHKIWDPWHQINGMVGAFPAHAFPIPSFLVLPSASPPNKPPQLSLGGISPGGWREREAGKSHLGRIQAAGCASGKPGSALVTGLSIWEFGQGHTGVTGVPRHLHLLSRSAFGRGNHPRLTGKTNKIPTNPKAGEESIPSRTRELPGWNSGMQTSPARADRADQKCQGSRRALGGEERLG